jgi:hypothetical protein
MDKTVLRKRFYYEGTGLVIISKRMDKGTFSRFNPKFFHGSAILIRHELFLVPSVFKV